MSKKASLLLFAGAMSCAVSQLQAAPIEHLGDRYIIHVQEMELSGEESLLDVLMACPEVLTIDGNNIIGGDPFSNLYGKFVIRIDNQEYGLDYATLLHHFKAREIESIKVCQNSEVMKGCSSLKKVIDITLRKGDNGVGGRVGLTADSYGGGKGIVSLLSQQDKWRVLSHVEGNLQRTSSNAPSPLSAIAPSPLSAIATSTINHYAHEGAKLNLLWTPTKNDVLEIDAMQTYTRNHLTDAPADYVRAYHLQADYTRTLGDNGSTLLITLGAEHISDKGKEDDALPYKNQSTYPFAVLEWSAPVLTNDLWLTVGFEGGLSIEKNCISEYTNHSNYEDLYAQLDYTMGKWGFMAGDRFRTINFRLRQIASAADLRHSTHNHAYTFSIYHHFTPANTLQAVFCRRIFNAEFGDFVTSGDMEGAWKPTYTTDITNRVAYVAELKHSYSKPSFVLSTTLRNIHQDLPNGEEDNALGFGSSAFWHQGILRLTAGFNYYWEKTLRKSDDQAAMTSRQSDGKHHASAHFAIFKLAPQLTFGDGWRLASNLIWCTRRPTSLPTYSPANLYAELGIYKSWGKHWTLEGRYHDIAGQNYGNRALTVGCTYYY